MSLFDEAMSGKFVRVRNGVEVEMQGSISGNNLMARADTDLKYGDVVRTEGDEQEYVVSDVKNNRGPGRSLHRLSHMSAKLTPIEQWEAEMRRETGNHVTQHIGSANIVAGRDVHLTISASAFLRQLESEIENNPAIPPEEKKSWMAKVKEFATNPEVWASMVKALGKMYSGG